MTTETIHTCSYACERPACIRAQRDELASRLADVPPPASARGDGRGLPAGWALTRLKQHEASCGACGRAVWDRKDSGNCIGFLAPCGNRVARLEDCGTADCIEALAAEGVQAGEVEQRARAMFEAQADRLAAPWDRQWEPTKEHWRAEARAALSQQPEARGVVDGEVVFNAAFFVSRTGDRIEQLTTYEDYRRDGALLALMDAGQKRASARGLTKKNAGKVELAWVTAPQIVECGCALTGERNG